MLRNADLILVRISAILKLYLNPVHENTTTTISCFRPDDGSVGEEDFESDQLYHSEFHSKRGGVAQSQVNFFCSKGNYVIYLINFLNNSKKFHLFTL